MWQVFGLSFHWYGLIVGGAVFLGWWNFDTLLEKQQQEKFTQKEWLGLGLVTLLSARIWHVVTDWHWYESVIFTHQWWHVLAVWHGGLSILGAVVGMAASLWWLRKQNFLLWLDCLALVLPWSQAVGRLANWVNQELYGWPTQLPWGISIDAEQRVAAVQFLPITTKFHPLFLYEALGMLLLGWGLSKLNSKHHWRLGGGKTWWCYVIAYSGLRFLLDFLRIDRGPTAFWLGFNQWFLLVCGGLGLIWLVHQRISLKNLIQAK